MRIEVEEEAMSWTAYCESLWNRYSARLFLLARMLLRDDAAAQDALQDVFVRLLQCKREFDDPAPYLFQATRNASLNALRSQRRRQAKERVGAWFSKVTDSRELEEFRNDVEQALAQLSQEGREAIALKIWSGLTAHEAAEIAGVSPEAFESRYYRALRELETRLKSHD